MRYEKREITVEGQVTGPASVDWYLLDSVSVAPDKKRPLVIVCPGGGYAYRSDREAEPVVMKFLAMGYHCGLMNYSVAPSRFPTSLLELAEAVAAARENAGRWNADPEQIYVCGFSAGGHLVCSLGVFWNQPFVSERIGRTAQQVRPDGLILAYPVITAGEFAHQGSFDYLLGNTEEEEKSGACLEDSRGQKWNRQQVSLELQVTPETPPVFLWHTYEDASVPVENSLLLASALRKCGVSLELHIYPKGPHGLALASDETSGSWRPDLLVPPVQNWVELAHTWIEGRKK